MVAKVRFETISFFVQRRLVDELLKLKQIRLLRITVLCILVYIDMYLCVQTNKNIQTYVHLYIYIYAYIHKGGHEVKKSVVPRAPSSTWSEG